MSFDHHQHYHFSISQREIKLSQTIVVADDASTRVKQRNNFWNQIFTCSCQDATKIVLDWTWDTRTHAQTNWTRKQKQQKNRPTNFINTLSLKKRSHASKIEQTKTELNSTLIKWKFAWRNETHTQTHARTQTKIKNLFANENFTAAFYTLRIFRRVYS